MYLLQFQQIHQIRYDLYEINKNTMMSLVFFLFVDKPLSKKKKNSKNSKYVFEIYFTISIDR